MHYVYILKCGDETLYNGETHDLEKRLYEHNKPENVNTYTAKRLPVELLWFQSFPNKWQAFKVERQLKGWSRKKKLAMIAGKWDLVKILSRGKTS